VSLVAHGLVGGLVAGGGGATLGVFLGGASTSLLGLGGSSIRGGSWCALQHSCTRCMGEREGGQGYACIKIDECVRK
jgi:hypothetical protein